MSWWGRRQSGRKYVAHEWRNENERTTCGKSVAGMSFLSSEMPDGACPKCAGATQNGDSNE